MKRAARRCAMRTASMAMGLALIAGSAHAAPDAPLASITLGGYLSGNWYNPAQGGHGFQFEFTDQDSTLIAVWFVFAPSGGAQNWIFAQGPYDHAANSVTIDAELLDGAQFPPQFKPADVQRTPWGTLTFTFSDCDHAQVSWSSTLPGYGNGSMALTRLTSIRGLACPATGAQP